MEQNTTNDIYKMKSVQETLMHQGVEHAQITMRKGWGGPFGAVITGPDGTIIAVASNTVLRDNDPTAHAEINAIRIAGIKLKTHDLSGCTLYATGYPCPMCLSAIIWANIKQVYYGCTPKDADAIGFRDDFIYDFIKDSCTNGEVLKLDPVGREDCMTLFEEYHNSNSQLY